MQQMPVGFTDVVANVEAGYDNFTGEFVEIWFDNGDREPVLLDRLFTVDTDTHACDTGCGSFMHLDGGGVETCSGMLCPRCANEIPWCCHDHFGEDRD